MSQECFTHFRCDYILARGCMMVLHRCGCNRGQCIDLELHWLAIDATEPNQSHPKKQSEVKKVNGGNSLVVEQRLN